MKKVLLLSLSLALGFCAFAQQRVAKNDLRQAQASAKKVAVGKEMVSTEATNFAPVAAKSVVVNRFDELEDGETMVTTYDLQSNHYVANRMYQLPNGSVAVTATMSHEPNQTASDRGTGYNFYKDGVWQDQPEERVENFRTGWPSIAQWKENGEILLCHGNSHMQCFTREIAGEGEWEYRGALPDYPEGYPYPSEYPTWPRVTTCGPNNNIIVAVGALQHSISSDETDTRTVMWRSEDAENWTVSYGPLEEYDYHIGTFSADDYCVASHGNTVAILYTGCLTNSTWMFKSTDCGLTWETTKIWEHPWEGRSFEEVFDYGDTLFIPMSGAMTIDKNDVVHVALNTFEMTHTLDNDPGYYSYFYGRGVDGILYWNDTQEAPIQDTEHPEYLGTGMEEHLAHPNPFHAARLWWPIPDDPGYVHMVPDSTKWIGYMPMYENISFESDLFYHNETDYYQRFYGTSGHPALSCDPYGNLACAYSSPCTARLNDNGDHYYRSIYVSYRNVDKGYWDQVVDDITDQEVNFMFLYSDNLFTIGVNNTITPGEFWFGFQSDDIIGMYWGSNSAQTSASDNTIHAVKLNPEMEYWGVEENSTVAQDVAYGLYPNPATDYVVVKSSQDVEANISIVNLVGQTVKQFNKSLKMGENAISLDLKSGIYFCTISANGFNKTIKFVVK